VILVPALAEVSILPTFFHWIAFLILSVVPLTLALRTARQKAERIQRHQDTLIEASDVFAAATSEAEVERVVVASCLRMIQENNDVTVAYARIDGDVVMITEASGRHQNLLQGTTCTLEELVANVAVEITVPSLCADIPTLFGAYLRSDNAVCGVLWIGGVGVIADDIYPILDTLTNQAVASAERLRSEQRLKSMVESSADVLAVIRPDGIVDWISPAVTNLTGRTVASVVEQHLEAFVHADDVPALRDALEVDPQETPTIGLRWSKVDGLWSQTESKLCAIAVSAKGTWWTLNSRDVSERVALEVELRHAQKLEAIGRLAAGVAHEINTPVQFIGSNLEFLSSSMSEFVDLLNHYRAVVEKYRSHADANAISSELQLEETKRSKDFEEQADIDFLTEQVPLAINEARDGANRVASIVRSMTTFGHRDGACKMPMVVNNAINSTLTIAQNEWKYVADVDVDLSDVPDVVCFAGDIKQVLLNLFVNAGHAIADRVGGINERGSIRVRNYVEGEFVVIEVGDSGTGIPLEIQQNIFDPFFTTKEVGRGTGQGLALAKSVMDRHRGTITFDTIPGKGTTFFLRLPINPPNELSSSSAQ
jgi:PAS domain S-box-containing protein